MMAVQVKSLISRMDVFNYVIDHLRRQGTPSMIGPVGGSSSCAYRGGGGAMCAVGALITDDEYNPAWENKRVCDLLEKNLLPPALAARLKPHEEMLQELQNFHDNYLEYVDGVFTDGVESYVDELRKKWSMKAMGC